MENQLSVALDPEQRLKRIEQGLHLLGLKNIIEDPNAAYCALPLTSAPTNAKEIIRSYQDAISAMLNECGIAAYDPGTAPLSPDLDLESRPDKIFATDIAKIASSRFFVTAASFPSTGVGIEWMQAVHLIKVPIILTSAHIRISRMQPPGSIMLQLRNLPKDIPQVADVVRFIKPLEIGLGFQNDVPVLLGFDTDGKVINLESAVEEEFPGMKYEYDGTQPAVKVSIKNLKIFEEL